MNEPSFVDGRRRIRSAAKRYHFHLPRKTLRHVWNSSSTGTTSEVSDSGNPTKYKNSRHAPLTFDT